MPTLSLPTYLPFGIQPQYHGTYCTPVGHVRRKASPTNTPERALVRLHLQPTGVLVSETWSDAASGEYQFRWIPPGRYYAVAFDHTGAENGDIVTDIVAVPMEPTP